MSELPPSFVILAAVLLLTVVAGAVAVVWLWRRQRRLERLVDEWVAGQRRQGQDLAGLCAAGLRIDARLTRLEQALAETREWLQARPPAEAGDAAAYRTAIALIREGAGIEELVSECGFTREEAGLLIRLHRDESGEDGLP